MTADTQAIEHLADLPEIIAIAAGHSHTAESALRLLAEFGYPSSVIRTMEEFGLTIFAGNEWRLDPSLRKRVLVSASATASASWLQSHEYLFEHANQENDTWLPTYQLSGAGLAYHGAELNIQVGLEGYRRLAHVDSVALNIQCTQFADEQVQRGLFANMDESIVFLRGMTYYRMGLLVEAVELLRKIANSGAQTREAAVSQHLVGNWDCLRSRRGDPYAAREMLSASHKLAAKLGDEVHLAHVKHTMALCLLKTNPKQRGSALRLLHQSLRLASKHGDRWGEAKILHSLGQALAGTAEGRLALEQSLALGRELGYPRHMAMVLESLDRYSTPTSSRGRTSAARRPSGLRLKSNRDEIPPPYASGSPSPEGAAAPKLPSSGGAVSRGIVKWFNAEMGFGFISQDGGGPDVFVHYSAIDAKGYRSLGEAQHVEFEVTQGPKGPQALQVRPTSPADSAITVADPSKPIESPPGHVRRPSPQDSSIASRPNLSSREVEVLRLLSNGIPRKSIGERMSPPISEKTVVMLLNRIVKKYRRIGRNVANKRDAVLAATQDGYLERGSRREQARD